MPYTGFDNNLQFEAVKAETMKQITNILLKDIEVLIDKHIN